MPFDIEANDYETQVQEKPNSCKGNFFCNALTALLLFMFTIIFIFQYILPYSESNKYIEQECLINKVEYPTSLPYGDNDGNAWSTCDCGRRCESWSPCISIYTNISDNEIKLGDNYYDGPSSCTFHNDQCRDGEDYRIIEDYLNESNQTYIEYINKTVTCYINDVDNTGYLNKEQDITSFVFYIIIMSILVIILLCVNILCCRK